MTNKQSVIDVFGEIDALNFPLGEFLVAGSAIMAVKGIRPAHDLDIVVSKSLFETCKKDDRWELKSWTRPGSGADWLRGDRVEILLHLNSGQRTFYLEDLIERAEVVHGVLFLSLEQLVEFKTNYGRPKDFEDIVLIQDYLRSH